jgi:hypothetical protein
MLDYGREVGHHQIVPAVEVAHDRDLLGFRGPYREPGACIPLSLQQVGPQFFIEAEVATFVKEIEIIFAQ